MRRIRFSKFFALVFCVTFLSVGCGTNKVANPSAPPHRSSTLCAESRSPKNSGSRKGPLRSINLKIKKLTCEANPQ